MKSDSVIETLQQVAKIGDWYVNLTNNEVYWSDEVYHIHEEDTSKEILLEDGISYYIEEHRPLITSCIEQAISDNKPWDVELKIKTAKNKIKWVRALGRPVFSEDKSLIGLEGVFQDIDSYKNLTHQLILANKKYELALKAARLGHWNWNISTDDLEWDNQMYDMYDVSKEEKPSVEFSDWSNKVHPDDLDRAVGELTLAKESNSDFLSEFRIIRNDGSIRYIEAQATTVLDDMGKVTHFTGINKDITEDIDHKKAMAYKTRELQNVFDAIPALVIHKSKDDRMIMVNKFTADSMNTIPEKMNGRRSSDFYDLDLCEQYHKDDLEVIESGKAKLGIVEQVPDAKGSLSWYKTDKVPYYNSSGEIDGIVLCAFNMTEQMNRQKELEHLNDELVQFNYRIAHDLGAPVATIKGLSKICQIEMKNNNYKEVEENIQKIFNSSHNLLQLIKDLLNLSRSEQIPSKKEKIIFKSLITDQMRGLTIPENFKIETDLDVLSINAIKVRLSQVFFNLISNSIKYRDKNEKESWLKIRSEHSGSHYIQLIFEDNGLGIDEDYRSKVFTMFSRFHHGENGSGLGLYLVKKHLSAMGGEIDFKNTKSGIKFILTLPKI